MDLMWYHYLIGAILILASAVIVFAVMNQKSQQQGLSGAIAGGSDTFFEKNKGRTKDAFFAKVTKIGAAVFFVVALVATIVFAFVK